MVEIIHGTIPVFLCWKLFLLFHTVFLCNYASVYKWIEEDMNDLNCGCKTMYENWRYHYL